MTPKGIIKFEPNRVWRTYRGGKLLDRMEGKTTGEDAHFPEDWIGSLIEARNPGRDRVDEGLTYVQSGSGKRIAFRDLLGQDEEYYLGSSSVGRNPLDSLPLVKYLDSATRLHFQVHPTAAFARERLGSNRGKTEAYVILAIRDAVENPHVYAGFQRPPGREDLKRWIIDQNIEAIKKCFTPIPVKPGDVLLIPGGRPHALGEGILMLEIMEASDLAVRFEFERDGFVIPEEARFMGRDIETALDVFNLEPVEDGRIDAVFRCAPKILRTFGSNGRLEELIGYDRTPCFAVRRSIVSGTFEKIIEEGFIGIVTDGEGHVVQDGIPTTLKRWDRFFCPSGVGHLQYSSRKTMTVIECYGGKLTTEDPESTEEKGLTTKSPKGTKVRSKSS